MQIIYRFAKQYYIPILIVLISKFIVLGIISGFAAYFLANPRASMGVLELWNVWDGPHYLSIARLGYQSNGDEANFIVFFPLFPLLIHLFNLALGISYLVSAYLVSFVVSVLLAVMFYKLVMVDYQKNIAQFAVILLFIFPTSFFLHIPYTESLFILLSISAFYFARRKKYCFSFLFVALASLTRITGLALIPAIFVEIFILDKMKFKFIFVFWGLLLSFSGFLIYLFLNYAIFGNPLFFTVIEKQNWYTTFSPTGQGLVSAFQSLSWRVGLEKIMLGYGQIIAFFLGLIMSIYVLIKVRLSYGIYMLLVLGSFSAMSFWLSMPRYIISLFPMFIVLALFSKNILFRYLWLFLSVTLLVILGSIFIQYGPVF